MSKSDVYLSLTAQSKKLLAVFALLALLLSTFIIYTSTRSYVHAASSCGVGSTGIKFEGSDIGSEPIIKTSGSFTVTISNWIEKSDSEGEYTGFSYTITGTSGESITFFVKSGEDTDGPITVPSNGSGTWISENGTIGSEVKGISNVEFCIVLGTIPTVTPTDAVTPTVIQTPITTTTPTIIQTPVATTTPINTTTPTVTQTPISTVTPTNTVIPTITPTEQPGIGGIVTVTPTKQGEVLGAITLPDTGIKSSWLVIAILTLITSLSMIIVSTNRKVSI